MSKTGETKRPSRAFLRFFAALALVCNGFDAWYTSRALTLSDAARELNPFMLLLMNGHGALFLVYKLLLVPSLLLLLYALCEHRAARRGLVFCAMFYYGNTVMQLLTMYHWWE